MIEYAFVLMPSLRDILPANDFVKNNKRVEVTKNTVVWIIILVVKKLVIIAKSAPIANQNIKKPTVAISSIKNIPDIINQICHINIPPYLKYNIIILQKVEKRKTFTRF